MPSSSRSSSTSTASAGSSRAPDSLHCYAYSSSTSPSSSCTPSPVVAQAEIFRCIRCARAVEATTTDDFTTTGMVRIATGLYYCHGCALSVGFVQEET